MVASTAVSVGRIVQSLSVRFPHPRWWLVIIRVLWKILKIISNRWIHLPTLAEGELLVIVQVCKPDSPGISLLVISGVCRGPGP